jgi:hypothetical protein
MRERESVSKLSGSDRHSETEETERRDFGRRMAEREDNQQGECADITLAVCMAMRCWELWLTVGK